MEAGSDEQGGDGQECCLSEGSAPINDIRVTKLLFGESCAIASCSCPAFAESRVTAVSVPCLPCCFAAVLMPCFTLHWADAVGMLYMCQRLPVSPKRT
jgi:hypothetical protein